MHRFFHVDIETGSPAASLFDASLHVIRVIGTVAGKAESLRCTARCLLAGSFPMLLGC